MPWQLTLTLCSPQVKPRTPKSYVHPPLNAPLFRPRTSTPAGMTLPGLHRFCISHFMFVMSGIYIVAILLLQSFLGAQQCGVPDHGLHAGAEQLASTAACPEEEDQEETEAQRKEKTGEEEGEAATPNALWSP